MQHVADASSIGKSDHTGKAVKSAEIIEREENAEARSAKRTRFALVIPALNEEDAIGSTLERALAARKEVIAKTTIDEMLVVFVNDGSTDRTQEIADRYPEVRKIRFEKNRGYGAAIKAGFLATDAKLVGFMDADGTCDPMFCIELINRLHETNADVVLGSRLNPESKMPLVRRIGNWIFARLIAVISGQSLSDSASGMRVIRRSSLRWLGPLPDGLHFTPVMSCVATLDSRLRIEEVPMPYEERLGRSKLSVIKDGIKFLATILFAASCYNPIKILVALGFLFCVLGAGLLYVALQSGISTVVVLPFVAAFLLVFVQATFIGLLCHQLLYTLVGPTRVPGRAEQVLQTVVQPKPIIIVSIPLFLLGLSLAAWGLIGAPSRQPLLWCCAGICVAFAGWLALGGIVLRVIWAVHWKAQAAREDPFSCQSDA